MKRKRIFIHFNYKGIELGTFGTFSDSADFYKIKKHFVKQFGETIYLNDSNIQIARDITGLKLKK